MGAKISEIHTLRNLQKIYEDPYYEKKTWIDFKITCVQAALKTLVETLAGVGWYVSGEAEASRQRTTTLRLP